MDSVGIDVKRVAIKIVFAAIGVSLGILLTVLFTNQKIDQRKVENEVKATRRVLKAITYTDKLNQEDGTDGSQQLLIMLVQWQKNWEQTSRSSSNLSQEIVTLSQFGRFRSIYKHKKFPRYGPGNFWDGGCSILSRAFRETLQHCEELIEAGKLSEVRQIVQALYTLAKLIIDDQDQGCWSWVQGIVIYLPEIRNFCRKYHITNLDLPNVRFEELATFFMSYHIKDMPICAYLLVLCSDSVPAWAYDASFTHLELVSARKTVTQHDYWSEETEFISTTLPTIVSQGSESLRAIASRYSDFIQGIGKK